MQHVRELPLLVLVGDVGGRRPLGRRVHAHVQRLVAAEGEAAPRRVELERGDAEVEEHAVGALEAGLVRQLGQLVEAAVPQRDGLAERGEPLARHLQHLRIAVDAHQPHAWRGLEDRARVPSSLVRTNPVTPADCRNSSACLNPFCPVVPSSTSNTS